MFDTHKKLKRYHAALCRYEEQILKKDHLLHESENLLSYMRKRVSLCEECNDALAAENKRLAENVDMDGDMMDEMYTEWKSMMRQHDDRRKLEEENYRLWVENALLRGELARLAPRKAAEIGNRG